jgi:hypothetical protein
VVETCPKTLRHHNTRSQSHLTRQRRLMTGLPNTPTPRPSSGRPCGKFPECGDLKHGFARGALSQVPGGVFRRLLLPGALFLSLLPPEAHVGEGELGGRARLRRCASPPVRLHRPQTAADKTEHNALGPFPEPGDQELAADPSRNFQH